MKKFFVLVCIFVLLLHTVACAKVQETTEVEETIVVDEEIDFNLVLKEVINKFETEGIGDLTGWNSRIFEEFSVSEDGKSLIGEVDVRNSTSKGYTHFITVEMINEALGFGEALNTKMGSTRPIDGMLSDENEEIKVTWSYDVSKYSKVFYVIYEKK